MTRERVDGRISCIGTATGTRLVIGRWAHASVALIEFVDGHRVLIAPKIEDAALLVDPSTVAEMRSDEITCDDLGDMVTVTAGDLVVSFTHGMPTVAGRLLGLIPSTVPAWVTGTISRVALGVGSTAHRVVGHRPITAAVATWKGDELGELADITPPVAFVLGSTPTSPSTLAVHTDS